MLNQGKVNFIVPYFGRFPNYFQLFLDSCKTNYNYNWTIITDNKEYYDFPNNVKIIRCGFTELRNEIQNKFDFKISLENPYKLCDYKPTYGYIFESLNKGYEFWGYCDIDVILGNLDEFLKDNLKVYDKLFKLGHMTIIKNKDYFNKMFMKDSIGKNFYKKVLSSKDIFNFDEEFGKPNINNIFEKNNISIYDKEIFADIYTKSSNFLLVKGSFIEKKNESFFIRTNEGLFRFIKKDNSIVKEEYLYIHLQKRKMNINIDNKTDIYKIIPNSFDPLEISFDSITDKFNTIKKKHINTHYFRIRFKNLKIKLSKRFINKF